MQLDATFKSLRHIPGLQIRIKIDYAEINLKMHFYLHEDSVNDKYPVLISKTK